jgi:hypothetical protein
MPSWELTNREHNRQTEQPDGLVLGNLSPEAVEVKTRGLGGEKVVEDRHGDEGGEEAEDAFEANGEQGLDVVGAHDLVGGRKIGRAIAGEKGDE